MASPKFGAVYAGPRYVLYGTRRPAVGTDGDDASQSPCCRRYVIAVGFKWTQFLLLVSSQRYPNW
jgi:hypothetical protein